MPTTATYSGYYWLLNFDDTTGTWTDTMYYRIPNQLHDDVVDMDPTDGSTGDGIETDGEYLREFVEGGSQPLIYSGWTFNGDPIVANVEWHPAYYLYTNNATLSGPGTATAGDYVYCFARGTQIATADGERAVESLAIGDLVLTNEGKCAPVKWIGRQTRHPLFAKKHGQLPVLIKAGALGEDLPTRDLYLSPDHAMLVDGVLVHALALVNGVSIVQMNDWPHENVEYYHIELENHELILAEGAPAETFVDNVSRKSFDNYAEYAWLYGEGSPIPEMSLPRVKTRRQLSSQTRKRLLGIASKRLFAAA